MPEKKPFWETAPGLITGIAAIVTGLAALIPILLRVTRHEAPKNNSAAVASPSPTATPTSTAGSGGPTDTFGGDVVPLPEGASPGTAGLVASPASADFGRITVSSSPQERTVIVSNQGVSPVTIDKVQITGDNAFSITGTSCGGSTLAPQGSCQVTVRFTPVLGVRSASIVLSSRQPPSAGPTTVPVTGTGAIL
jgi:hypothetical protein